MSSIILKNSKRLSISILRYYQWGIVEWIISKPFCAIYAEMGLGKTVSTLTALDFLIAMGIVKRVLILAPKRVALHTWPDEFDLWEHTHELTRTVIVGSPAQRGKALKQKTQFHIINDDLLVWLVEYWGKDWPYDTVVIDEASRFKSHAAKKFKAMRKVRPRLERIIELTGTPAAQSLLSLWSQIFMLDVGRRLGKTWTFFRNNYFTSDYQGYTWTPKKGTREAIERAIRDVCLSLRAKDHLDLEKPVALYDWVDLPAKAAAEYKEVNRHLYAEIFGEEVVAANAAVKSGKLSQIAQGAVYVGEEGEERRTVAVHDEKLDKLEEIIEKRAGQNILLAYQFKSDLERLQARFPYIRTLDDTTPAQWNEGSVKLLAVHPQSAGHGLNLQHGGHVIVWFGLTWSLELYQQFNARLARSGQEFVVFIHHILARGTVDEVKKASLAERDTTQSAVMDALRRHMRKFIG